MNGKIVLGTMNLGALVMFAFFINTGELPGARGAANLGGVMMLINFFYFLVASLSVAPVVIPDPRKLTLDDSIVLPAVDDVRWIESERRANLEVKHELFLGEIKIDMLTAALTIGKTTMTGRRARRYAVDVLRTYTEQRRRSVVALAEKSVNS